MVRLNKQMVYRPLLILAYADSAHAALCGRYFRRHGWEVRLAPSAAEARRLLAASAPRAIVLATDLPDESGWLTCAKITQEDAARKVILLSPGRALDQQDRLAQVQAVAHERMIEKARGGIDHAQGFNEAFDLVQRSQSGAHGRQDIDAYQPGGRLPLFERQLGAELAEHHTLAVFFRRSMPGDIEHVA